MSSDALSKEAIERAREHAEECLTHSGRVEEDALYETIRALIAERERLLADARKLSRGVISAGARADHACARCVPGGEIVIDGFVCAFHLAKDIEAGQ